MEDLVVRPSTKIVMASYAVATLMMTGGVLATKTLMGDSPYWWMGAIPGIGFEIAVLIRHLGLLTEKLTFSADHLYHEIGFISKSTRTINLAKVQDVTVFQSVTQRMLGTGRITVETSGGSSAITIANVDNPHKVADTILERSRMLPNHPNQP